MWLFGVRIEFQCSSASRKFLNRCSVVTLLMTNPRFSALQRAENSSIENGAAAGRRQRRFQCSSASRKFLNLVTVGRCSLYAIVSVLFSEPKIPQCIQKEIDNILVVCFSALQRAENSSIIVAQLTDCTAHRFQCSSASRKFLNGKGEHRNCACK